MPICKPMPVFLCLTLYPVFYACSEEDAIKHDKRLSDEPFSYNAYLN